MTLHFANIYKNFCRTNNAIIINILRYKKTIDYSLVPTINEDDIEEQFVRGDGPGGQAVAKTNNCVILKHKPTGKYIHI